MAFAVQQFAFDDARMPISGVLSSGMGLWETLEAKGQEPVARRSSAAGLALLLTYLTFSALNGPMSVAKTGRPLSRAIETITLTLPPPDRADPPPAARAAETSPSAPIASPGSMVDTSTPTPLSNPEWSVSPLRIAMPRRNVSVGNTQSARSGSGVGIGSAGVYDPYAGATPIRAPDQVADQPALVPGALAEATRRARARGILSDVVRCDLLIALTGAVIEANCRSASGVAATDLAGLLVGQRLYVPAPRTHRFTIEIEP